MTNLGSVGRATTPCPSAIRRESAAGWVCGDASSETVVRRHVTGTRFGVKALENLDKLAGPPDNERQIRWLYECAATPLVSLRSGRSGERY